MPSIEFWFLLHFVQTDRFFGTSKAVLTELLKHLPSFKKNKSFLSSRRWVETLCKEGKLQKAYSKAKSLGAEAQSYSNLWRAVEYLGLI
ncbi:MAG: RloB domain-containing protein [Porphyromonadaceae bacterium]|nr:RloB domain-containing protein [Porphyromonadaceae bacterium]